MLIRKRDGILAEYDVRKIEKAIEKAMLATNVPHDAGEPAALAKRVEEVLFGRFDAAGEAGVEDVQNIVEDVLSDSGYKRIARAYTLYLDGRAREREKKSPLMRKIREITTDETSDILRDNANIDGNSAMGIMLKFGTELAKDFYEKEVLSDVHAAAHKGGDIHIHDFDFYTLTTTCCQIDLVKLFEGGFSTGHGFLREPNDIQSYAALACIAIQSNQNDQHGGQSIPNFDYALAKGVEKTYKRIYRQNIAKALFLTSEGGKGDAASETAVDVLKKLEADTGLFPKLAGNPEYDAAEADALCAVMPKERYESAKRLTLNCSGKETERATNQAMEALIHNLNTMHSRAGAQTPFSSINYGTDTSPEGRMVINAILRAEEEGLGHGETPIFPIQIFKLKEGVNYNPGDPNYDLFKYACKVSATRLFPNFSFIDSPFNLQYYKPGRPETEIAYMGCRTRVIGNTYDPSNEIVYGRGNLSFTSINLPRIAIKAHKNTDVFYELLHAAMELVAEQLYSRFLIQCKKRVKNYPFLMGQGVWLGSDKLGANDSVAEVLRQGTLSIGFIGLAETLVALTGKHHGESKKSQRLGLEIISVMRSFCDEKSKQTSLNYTCLATPAEGLSGRFVRMDRDRFGTIPGVTDREYYTNSFHVPVYYPIGAYDKIKIEAPYHKLTNAGHISYVELDGDTAKNVEAFEKVIRCMHDAGMGYGSVNHPVDRDPACNHSGIIGDVCPKCGRKPGAGDIGFERIRRITGYLVGTLDRFNNAKVAEEKERVKHSL